MPSDSQGPQAYTKTLSLDIVSINQDPSFMLLFV